MAAAHYGLSNMCAIIDNNGLQIDGKNDDVMTVNPIGDKFRAFGWNVIECDGHDVDDLKRAFEEARAYTEGPSVLLAHTIKGKGVSFMEGQAAWHGKAPDDEQLAQALAEIDGEV